MCHLPVPERRHPTLRTHSRSSEHYNVLSLRKSLAKCPHPYCSEEVGICTPRAQKYYPMSKVRVICFYIQKVPKFNTNQGIIMMMRDAQCLIFLVQFQADGKLRDIAIAS